MNATDWSLGYLQWRILWKPTKRLSSVVISNFPFLSCFIYLLLSKEFLYKNTILLAPIWHHSYLTLSLPHQLFLPVHCLPLQPPPFLLPPSCYPLPLLPPIFIPPARYLCHPGESFCFFITLRIHERRKLQQAHLNFFFHRTCRIAMWPAVSYRT
jgi:hypothetical protein